MWIGRWAKRFAWALVALVAIVTLAVVVLIRSEWGRGKVRGLIESQASSILDGSFRVRRVSGSIVSGVTLADVTFVRNGQTVFSAKEVDVGYNAWSLARGGRQINFVRLVDPVIRLEESKGRWSPGDWVKPRPPSGRPSAPFVLAEIEFVNGRLLSSARESVWQLPPELDRINGTMRLRLGGPTELSISRLSFATPDNVFQAQSATGTLTFVRGTQLKDLRVASTSGTMTVNGTFSTSESVEMNLDVALDRFDTRVWRQFSPLMNTIALDASGRAAVGGTVSRLTVRAALDTTAGKIAADTVIASEANEVRITGTGDVARFDVEAVTLEPRWASAVTGRLRYTFVGAGTPAAWTAEIQIAGGPVSAFDVTADELNGTARYARNRVTFDTNARAYGAEGHATGTVLASPELVIDVTGDRALHVDPRRLPAAWAFPQLDASVNASAFEAHWTAKDWTATVRLEDSSVEGGTVAVGTTVDLTSAPGAVTLAAEGDVRAIDARRLGRALEMPTLDDPRFESSLNGHVRVTGHGPDWRNVDLAGRGAMVDSEVARARVTTAAVTYSRESRRNTARIVGGVTGFDPLKVGAPAAMVGTINGAADLIVEWQDDAAVVASTIVARGTLHLTPSTFAHEPVDRGVVSGEWRDGVFDAQALELEGRGLHVTGRGRLAITGGTSAATFEATTTDVAGLDYWIGRVFHGAATGRGEVRGTFDAPRIIATAESAEITDADYGRFTHVSGSIDFTLPDWDYLRANGPLRAQASTWVTAGGAVTREAVLDGRLDSSTTFHGRGTARFNEFVGQAVFAADWANEFSMDVTEASAARGSDLWRIDPSTGHLRITSSRLTAANVHLTNGVQTIAIDGALLLGDGEITSTDHLTATASNVDVEAIDRFLGLGAAITGRVSASVSLAGRLSDPRGRITLDGTGVSIRGYKIAGVTGVIDLAAGGATANITMKQPDGVVLSAVGRVPLSAVLPAGSLAASVPSPDWDLNLVTQAIELKIFGPVTPQLEDISGEAIIDVRIVGAADAAKVTGTIALADAAFRAPAAGIAFTHVTADIGLQPDLITVRRFAALDKHGHRLTITGELAVSERQVGRVNVNVEADRVEVVDNAIGSIELSALLQLAGAVAHPKLTGNVEVVSGRVEVDHLLRVLQGDPLALVAETNLPPEGETVVDLREQAAREAAEAATRPGRVFDSKSFLSALDVDVRILAPDNLILRGSSIRPSGKDSWSLGDVNVTVGGELTATRRPEQSAQILGDVTTIRGVYSFEGRRFEIQRGGRIRFNGEVPADPTFDVRGIRRIQGVEARVDVRGRLSNPTLELGSDLPLDDADILSMIIFNRPVNQLGEAQRADLVGTAASLAGGFVTAPLATRLSRALDLDLLEVETVSFGQNVAPRVRVGQQIGNRLFVQFAQQFGQQSLSELTAEYQLARFLRLQANSSQGPGSRAQRSLLQRTERFGLDLIFFFSY